MTLGQEATRPPGPVKTVTQKSRTTLSDRELVVELVPVVFSFLYESGFRDEPSDSTQCAQANDAVALHIQSNFGVPEVDAICIAQKSVLWTVHVARNSARDRPQIGRTPDGDVLDDTVLGLELGMRFLERVVIMEARYSTLFPQAPRPKSSAGNERGTLSPNDVRARSHPVFVEPLPDPSARRENVDGRERRVTRGTVQQYFSHSQDTHYHINNTQPPRSMVSAVVFLLMFCAMVLFYLLLALFG